MDTKRLLLAQLLMTLIMAILMSGTMSLLMIGPSLEWLATWPRHALLAWPFAFVFSLGVSRLVFGFVDKLWRGSEELTIEEEARRVA